MLLLYFSLCFLNILSAFDLILTLQFLALGGEEGNPFLNYIILTYGVMWFARIKLLMVFLGSIWLGYLGYRRILLSFNVVYSAVIGYHFLG